MKRRQVLTGFVAFIASGFAFTGLASAASITHTGPNSYNKITSSEKTSCKQYNTNKVSVVNRNQQRAVSGNAASSHNTVAGWGSWDPAAWQQGGHSFHDWWSGLIAWSAKQAHSWPEHADQSEWMPEGTNWETSWSNWDPSLWKANGHSFSSWHNKLMHYLNDNAALWMSVWPNEHMTNGGTARSGNASNSNATALSVTINNRASIPAQRNSSSCFVSASAGQPAQPGAKGGHSTSRGSTRSSGGVMGASVHGGTGLSGYGGSARTSSPAPASSTSGPITTTPRTNSSSTEQKPGYVKSPAGSAAHNNTISNTGPDSTNVIKQSHTNTSSTTNNNYVGVQNTNIQYASSGSSSSSSGTATNGNNTGSTGTIAN